MSAGSELAASGADGDSTMVPYNARANRTLSGVPVRRVLPTEASMLPLLDQTIPEEGVTTVVITLSMVHDTPCNRLLSEAVSSVLANSTQHNTLLLLDLMLGKLRRARLSACSESLNRCCGLQGAYAQHVILSFAGLFGASESIGLARGRSGMSSLGRPSQDPSLYRLGSLSVLSPAFLGISVPEARR